MDLAILYTLGSTLLFSLASIAFTVFSREISVAWMNFFKASIATICFLVLAIVSQNFYLPEGPSALLLFLSGVVGLCIGDMFLFKSYTRLGPGRTLILFSFHPIFTGIGSYFLFNQGLSIYQLIAIIFMLACVFTLGKENIDETKSWRFLPILIALFGISLDAGGVLLTRQAFELSPNLDSSMANLIRGFACVFSFSIWSLFRPIGLTKHYIKLSTPKKIIVTLSACFGTFVSLFLYLKALKIGHLASISAITATGPIWASIFEYLFFKQKPSHLLYYTFGLFTVGMFFLYI